MSGADLHERITVAVHEELSPLLTDTLGMEHGWDAAEGVATAIIQQFHSKRFTDAELAAEYWAAHGEANALMTGNRRLLFSRRAALKRFATLPHYDEPTPPRSTRTPHYPTYASPSAGWASKQ